MNAEKLLKICKTRLFRKGAHSFRADHPIVTVKKILKSTIFMDLRNAGGRTWKDTTLKKCRKDKALAAVFFSGQPIGQPNILDYLRVTPFPTNRKRISVYPTPFIIPDVSFTDTSFFTVGISDTENLSLAANKWICSICYHLYVCTSFAFCEYHPE